MATVQFSLTAAQFEILQGLSNPGESLNLTAKRVLVSILEANYYPDQTEQYRSQTIAELQERINKIEADRLSQDHRFGVHIESLEDRIEKLETEIEMLTTPKQPATPNNGESVIFLADSEGEPIQFWSGQLWVDDLNLAYRYKGAQAMARAIDKLKKRKLSGNGSPGTAIGFAPIKNLLENGES